MSWGLQLRLDIRNNCAGLLIQCDVSSGDSLSKEDDFHSQVVPVIDQSPSKNFYGNNSQRTCIVVRRDLGG